MKYDQFLGALENVISYCAAQESLGRPIDPDVVIDHVQEIIEQIETGADTAGEKVGSAMSESDPCTSDCYRDVKCVLCGETKKLYARLDQKPDSKCDDGCDGYYMKPLAPHLFDEEEMNRENERRQARLDQRRIDFHARDEFFRIAENAIEEWEPFGNFGFAGNVDEVKDAMRDLLSKLVDYANEEAL